MKLDIKTLFIEFFISILGAAEAINLLALAKHMQVDKASKLFLVAFILVSVAFIVILTILVKKDFSSIKAQVNDIKSNKLSIFIYICFIAMVIFQIIFHYHLCKPYIAGDITGETVTTFIRSNEFHTINPMTGLPYTEGIPNRLKILCIPSLYAFISSLTGINPYTLCYRLAPAFIVPVAYLVYSLYAKYLFGKDTLKKPAFMLIISFVLFLGFIGTITETRFLMTQAWSPEAIRNTIILPFIIISLFNKKWWDVVICILAEAVLCWTLYGLGYGVVLTALYLIVSFVYKTYRKKKEVSNE